MSPEQIALVVASRDHALDAADDLSRALAERLPGPPASRTARATWIVLAVSRLSLVLDHPRAFAALAADDLARRVPVRVDEMVADREALLGALEEVGGPFGPELARAWALAIGLFGEIVASACLDPFGVRAAPAETVR